MKAKSQLKKKKKETLIKLREIKIFFILIQCNEQYGTQVIVVVVAVLNIFVHSTSLLQVE